jgi:tRNA-Thr(GGU) m(6)t(6)A37 methyltransferase TsaA
MGNRELNPTEIYQSYPIGVVNRIGKKVHLEISEPFRPALRQLEYFSHVMVFWWADRFDDLESRQVLECNPPYAEEHLTGVFATRSPLRPNPIAMTTCKILGVDKENGLVEVADIDAFDGTRLIDLKAYFPVCDRIENAKIPEWLTGWPEWMPENGIGLMEGES